MGLFDSFMRCMNRIQRLLWCKRDPSGYAKARMRGKVINSIARRMP